MAATTASALLLAMLRGEVTALGGREVPSIGDGRSDEP
jgi:hypothetical protein